MNKTNNIARIIAGILIVLAGCAAIFYAGRYVGTLLVPGATVHFVSGGAQDSGANAAAAAPPSGHATLIAAGDIMLARGVAVNVAKNGGDVNYPFAKISDYLHSADIAFANLENPITAGPPVPDGSMVFHADPGVQNGLKNAGLTILNLANNHTPNFGAQGILDTLTYLKGVGIASMGAGANADAAGSPAYLTANGIKFAFLGYNDTDVVPPSYGATATSAGTNFFNIPKMQAAVKAARANVDIVIVSMHAGHEYQPGPDPDQVNFAHAAIDAGADLVVGAHPHVIQPAEKYHGKYILYSLGNFVFDQDFSKDTMQGMTVEVFFDKNPASATTAVSKIEFNPIVIPPDSQPYLMTDPADLAHALGRLQTALTDGNYLY